MVEPSSDRCLPKMKRLSISNFGPPVLPTVRMRPPLRAARKLSGKVVPTLSTTTSTPRLFGQLVDRLGPVFVLRAVDQVVRPQRLGQLQLLWPRADHVTVAPASLAIWMAGRVHPAGCAHHQHALPGAQIAPRVISECQAVWKTSAGGGSHAHVEAFRQGVSVDCRDDHVLGVGAAHASRPAAPSARSGYPARPGSSSHSPQLRLELITTRSPTFQPGDPGAQRGDLARPVGAGDVRVCQLDAGPAVAHHRCPAG